MRKGTVVSYGTFLALLLGGCVAQDAREVLDTTAREEARIGGTGAQALAGVAALTSRLGESCGSVASSLTATMDGVIAPLTTAAEALTRATVRLERSIAHVGSLLDAATGAVQDARPGIREVAGITSELHAMSTIARGRLESDRFAEAMFIAVVVVLGVLLLHTVVWSLWMRAKIESIHEKFRALEVQEPEA